MIDLEQAKAVFLAYVKEFDNNNVKIKRKREHTLRTSDIAVKIATELNLEDEDIELAGLIGLLHDIGRFNQIKKFDTYNDSISINHAEESVRVLFEEGKIRDYIQDNKYDKLIKTAISNHNRFKIEDGLDERVLLHSKIIRDADKTDIFETFEREKTGETIFNYDELGKLEISDRVIEEFRNNRQVDRSILTNRLERYLNMISFIFDYNFVPGLKIVKEKHYIENMIGRIKNKTEQTEERLKLVKNIALEYIDKRLS